MRLDLIRVFFVISSSTYVDLTSEIPKNPYRFGVYPVETCPMNSAEFIRAARRRNCTGNLRYLCAPDKYLSNLIEFCTDRMRGLYSHGNCVLLEGTGDLDHYSCAERFTFGCPMIPYSDEELYRYPACLLINRDLRCFVADKDCQKSLPSSAENYVYNSEPNILQRAIFFVYIFLCVACLTGIIICRYQCLVCKKATKENNDKKRNSDEERESCSELSNTDDGASNWNKKYGERNMPVKITIKKIEEREKNLKQKPVTEKYAPKTREDKIKNIKNKANSVSTRLASTHPFSKGTHNQKCVLSSEIKAQVSRSVGLIYVDKMPAGTGFRVGEMYIVTCAHIIENVFAVWPHFIACDRMAIEFERKIFNQREDPFQIFLFQRDIAYLDEEHDFVVLKLKCHQAGVGFPPPLTCFGEVSISEIHIVGHPEGREMKEDDIFPYWSTDHENKIRELGNWSKNFFPDKEDYYSILLELPVKILFDTTFSPGASGSPGVIIRHNKPCVVLILAGGTPKYIYDNPYSTLSVKDDQKVEYGFPISDIIRKMWNSSKQNDKDLASNIFTEFI